MQGILRPPIVRTGACWAVLAHLLLLSSAAGVATAASTTTYCWGDGKYGQLGNGARELVYEQPVQVLGGHTFLALATGASHTCGIDADGQAWCWGKGDDGELGTGMRQNSSTPVPVTGGHSFVAIRAGGGLTCALTRDGQAFCW